MEAYTVAFVVKKDTIECSQRKEMPSPISAEPYYCRALFIGFRWNFEREIPAVPENLVHEMRKKQLGQLKWLEFTGGFRPTRVFAPYFRKPLEFRSQISGGILGSMTAVIRTSLLPLHMHAYLSITTGSFMMFGGR